MHNCPRCGQECDCSGDIDDIHVMTEEWTFMNCTCDDFNRDRDDWEWNDDEEPFAYGCCGCMASQINPGSCNICGNPTDPMY